MRVSIHVNETTHQMRAADAMAEGLRRHGIQPSFASWDQPRLCDVTVVWGWKQRRTIELCAASGVPILVMERGHLQPREEATSLGWNGLARRATYPRAPNADRWNARYAGRDAPWRAGDDGPVLVVGQVRGDASIASVDFLAWVMAATSFYRSVGRKVIYRPHPVSLANADTWSPAGAEVSTLPLREDLARAALVVTFNSTTGIEAALAGVPVIAVDQGAMAWPVACHFVGGAPERLDRARWCADLAWTQWSDEEIRSGEAWAALASCLPDHGPTT